MKLKKHKKRKNNNNVNVEGYPDVNNPFAEEFDVKLEAKKEKKRKKKEKKLKKGNRERVLSKSAVTQIQQGKINTNAVSTNATILHKNSVGENINNEAADNTLPDKHVKTLPLNRVAQLKQEDVNFKRSNKSQSQKVPEHSDSPDPALIYSLKLVEENEPHEKTSIPSVKVTNADTDIMSVRRNRTSSVVVSSRERRKKKGLKKLKKWRKKKKKDKNLESVTEGTSVSQTFNPKPKKSQEPVPTDELIQQVEEVKEIAQRKLQTQLAQRQSALIEAVENTDRLEDFANSFAKVSNEIGLKKKSQATCCGLFSKYRACWYICGCTRGIKNRKKKKLVDLEKAKQQSRAFTDLDDSADVAYGSDVMPTKSYLEVKERYVQNKRRASLGDKHSSTSSLFVGIKNSKLFQSISMASLPTGLSISRRGQVTTRSRKATSVSALEDLIKKRDEDITEFASQFEGDEDQQKVRELLLLDHS